LLYWKNPKNVNRRVARWLTTLQDYNFVIKHVPGKIHAAANMLSRPPGVNTRTLDNQDVVVLPDKLFIRHAELSEDDKQAILLQYHDNPTAGHPGRDNTIALVKRHHNWKEWIHGYKNTWKDVRLANRTKTYQRKPLWNIESQSQQQQYHSR
jgi:hypothetical protein